MKLLASTKMDMVRFLAKEYLVVSRYEKHRLLLYNWSSIQHTFSTDVFASLHNVDARYGLPSDYIKYAAR